MRGNRNALRPDAQAFDEIRIMTAPRFKTSGLSGDEWRISALVQFLRKGKVAHEASFSTVEHACGFLYGEYHTAIGDGKAYFAGDGVLCDQEGCKEQKAVTYRKVRDVCRDGRAAEPSDVAIFRHFCLEHSNRGDCGLDDANDNYRQVSGPAVPGIQAELPTD